MKFDPHTPAAPWHEGEVRLQRSLGVAERMSEVGPRVIHDHMPEQHRYFYPQLPFVVIGTVDAAGDAWATVRAGQPGFLRTPDPLTLRVTLPRDPTDPADAGLENSDSVGVLGIELRTKRRNRLNGAVHRRGKDTFDIDVAQAFGNCPKYVQTRDVVVVRNPATLSDIPPITSDGLDSGARDIVANADTFFIASYVGDGANRQVDVSHRGGKPGFVHIDDDGVLTVPDYRGNRFFNTLGNLLANPKAGLVFVDFTSGSLLQMTGDAEVILDSPEIAPFAGAERIWKFRPRRVTYRPQALPLRAIEKL